MPNSRYLFIMYIGHTMLYAPRTCVRIMIDVAHIDAFQETRDSGYYYVLYYGVYTILLD